MATPYSDIFDLSLMDYSNYELDKLYTISPTNFNLHMTGLLVRVIPSFTNCLKDLTQRNDTTQTFTIDLNDFEKDILASLIAAKVLEKEINDIRQIRARINDSEGSRGSEANLLKEKRETHAHLLELINKKMTDYGLSNENWSTFYDAEV